jgi:cytochrome c553
MRACLTAILLLGLTAAMAPGARAGGEPNRAKSIVAEFCVRCHEVPGYKARYGRASVAAPPFQAMADHPKAYPRSRIRGALVKPHYYMRGMVMSPQNIEDLVAFIESLRKKPK